MIMTVYRRKGNHAFLLMKDTTNTNIDNTATVVTSKYSNGTKSDPTEKQHHCLVVR